VRRRARRRSDRADARQLRARRGDPAARSGGGAGGGRGVRGAAQVPPGRDDLWVVCIEPLKARHLAPTLKAQPMSYAFSAVRDCETESSRQSAQPHLLFQRTTDIPQLLDISNFLV